MDYDILNKRTMQIGNPDVHGSCVLYVMSRDQRVNDNHALLAAQRHALTKKLPLAVVFCLYEKSGKRTREHYAFMLDGLRQVEEKLSGLGIPFVLLVGDGLQQLVHYSAKQKPDAVYFDFNPLSGPQKLIKVFIDRANTRVFVVDTHNIIPCWIVSDKKEYAAATFRPKVHAKLAAFLHEPADIQPHPYAWPQPFKRFKDMQEDIEKLLGKLPKNNIEYSFSSGEAAAATQLHAFIDNKLVSYAANRNNPNLEAQSDLSPYLHFGQISALRVCLELQYLLHKTGDELHLLHSKKMPQPDMFTNTKVAGVNELLEELIVRKELSDNYCYYEPDYLQVSAAANWARNTIVVHDTDERKYSYSLLELEHARTHDAAWNAAQKQLTSSGKIHGYMRMYWAKKVKEWTPDAQTAIDYLVTLNDRYHLDGGDPNGYAGIMWSVCGVHDRPWAARELFGQIRYMNQAGLRRKFDVDAYVKKF